jgi:hypothetical protein
MTRPKPLQRVRLLKVPRTESVRVAVVDAAALFPTAVFALNASVAAESGPRPSSLWR